MERKEALAIWDAIYGNKEWAVDCYGTWIYRNDHGEQTKKRIRPNGDGKLHNYGWEIDHIRPICDFDNENNANIYNNYEPVYWANNREKADNYPHFTINGKKYEVVKCNICKSHNLLGYGVQDENGERVDWKGKNNNCFTKN